MPTSRERTGCWCLQIYWPPLVSMVVKPAYEEWMGFFFLFWLQWVFVAARGLSLVAASGGYSLLQCAGFSCCGARALGVLASAVAACGLSSSGRQALERRLSSCGAWAWLLRSMWDLPRPGIVPVSPAVAGGFLTIAPPGKSRKVNGFCPLGSQQRISAFRSISNLPLKTYFNISNLWKRNFSQVGH